MLPLVLVLVLVLDEERLWEGKHGGWEEGNGDGCEKMGVMVMVG